MLQRSSNLCLPARSSWLTAKWSGPTVSFPGIKEGNQVLSLESDGARRDAEKNKACARDEGTLLETWKFQLFQLSNNRHYWAIQTMQKASHSKRTLDGMLSWSIVIAGRCAGRGIHIGCCGSCCCGSCSCWIHVMVVMMMVTVSSNAGQRVGCWSALCSQVMVIGWDGMLVGMVMKGLWGRWFQTQFVVWGARPTSCGTGEWHQATSTWHGECGAQHPRHELLVSRICMKWCPTCRFPLIVPPILNCICNTCQEITTTTKGTRFSHLSFRWRP